MAFTIRLSKAQEDKLNLFMRKLSVKTKQEAFKKMLKICLELISEDKNQETESANLSQKRSPCIFCICKNTEAAETGEKIRIKNQSDNKPTSYGLKTNQLLQELE